MSIMIRCKEYILMVTTKIITRRFIITILPRMINLFLIRDESIICNFWNCSFSRAGDVMRFTTQQPIVKYVTVVPSEPIISKSILNDGIITTTLERISKTVLIHHITSNSWDEDIDVDQVSHELKVSYHTESEVFERIVVSLQRVFMDFSLVLQIVCSFVFLIWKLVDVFTQYLVHLFILFTLNFCVSPIWRCSKRLQDS